MAQSVSAPMMTSMVGLIVSSDGPFDGIHPPVNTAASIATTTMTSNNRALN